MVFFNYYPRAILIDEPSRSPSPVHSFAPLSPPPALEGAELVRTWVELGEEPIPSGEPTETTRVDLLSEEPLVDRRIRSRKR